MTRIFLVSFVFCVITGLILACRPGATRGEKQSTVKQPKPTIERVAGDTDVVPFVRALDKGKVLISYSACAACHKAEDRKRGPAFHDIAARYPMNSTYINILAKRIIIGTKGSWGNAVMPPHPAIAEEDAETMVMYILSLNNGADR